MNTRNIKLLSVVTIATLLATSLLNDVFAQARAGINGGLNVSNLYIDDLGDENARYGFTIGVFGQGASSETFAIQPELLYSTKGSKAFYGYHRPNSKV